MLVLTKAFLQALVLGPPTAPPGPPVTIFFDTFAGSFGDPLNGHIPDIGTAWAQVINLPGSDTFALDGADNVQGNNNGFPVPLEECLAFTEASGNGTFTAGVVTPGGTDTTGYVFRGSDSLNFWRVEVDESFNLRLVKRVANVDTSVALSAPLAYADISITLNGSAIGVLLDGVSVISVADGFNASATKIGVYTRVGDGSNTGILGPFQFDH